MRRFVVLAILASAVALPASPSHAAGTTVLDATYTTVANGWTKVERYHDTDANFPTEAYPPDGRGDQEGQRLTFFGNVLRWDAAYLGRQHPVLPAAPGFARKVKPLVRLGERELAAYCVLTGIDYIVEECPMAAGNKHLGYK